MTPAPMKTLWNKAQNRLQQRSGHTLTEYTVIVSIISIAGVVLLIKIGAAAKALLEQTNSNMP